MNRRVLLVDDEPLLLSTYGELLATFCQIETAEGGAAGIAAIEASGPFAAIISDLNMPGMNGIEFLARARAISPESVRIMLTGCGDMQAAIAAVNQGSVFRFLSKPCPFESLVGAIEAALAHYQIQEAERELLEKTLSGSIRMMTEILSLVNAGAFGRAARVRRTMRHIATRLGLENRWQFELAGLLSQIGCVTCPPETLSRALTGQPVSPAEMAVLQAHPAAGAALLESIPRLEPVARMIALQEGPPAGTPFSSVLVADEPGTEGTSCRADAAFASARAEDDARIALGGEMLRLSLALDRALAQGHSLEVAMSLLRRETRRPHAPHLLAALENLPQASTPSIMRMARISQLDTSMVFDEDVCARNGMLLVTHGTEVTIPAILRLRSFAAGIGVVEPFRVLVRQDAAPPAPRRERRDARSSR